MCGGTGYDADGGVDRLFGEFWGVLEVGVSFGWVLENTCL